jgi:hypothetical protein
MNQKPSVPQVVNSVSHALMADTLLAKLSGGFGSEPESISTSDCCSFRQLARFLPHGILGLLQQYRPSADIDTNERAFSTAKNSLLNSGIKIVPIV